jgi:hypothetical protein
MAAPLQDWCQLADLTGECAEGIDGAGTAVPDADILTKAIHLASVVLYSLTNYAYPGTATDVVRPVCPSCGGYGLPFGMWGGSAILGPPVDLFAAGGLGTPWPFGGASGSLTRWWPYGMGCAPTPGVRLVPPVVSVEEVMVGGVILDPSKYKVLDHEFLVRTDQELFPCCSDARDADDADNVLRVTYTYGKPIPADCRDMCAVLACEYAKLLAGNLDGTRLPRSTTAVTREGITFAILDPGTAIQNGQTGLVEVDLWLAAKNRPRKRGTVSSVATWQANRARRVTWHS